MGTTWQPAAILSIGLNDDLRVGRCTVVREAAPEQISRLEQSFFFFEKQASLPIDWL